MSALEKPFAGNAPCDNSEVPLLALSGLGSYTFGVTE